MTGSSCAPRAALALIVFLAGASLRAQSPASARVDAGAPIRLTVTDPAALPRGAADRSTPRIAEGRFVRFDSMAVVVRLRGGYQLAYPASIVQRLEMRGDPMPQPAIWVRRALSAAGGAATGLLIGRQIARHVGRPRGEVPDDVADAVAADQRGDVRYWSRRGVLVGATFGVAMSFAITRRPWVAIPTWPSGA